ncbi:hypothetical protein BBK14_13825 [Parafrankia soli]|uniref:Uncharacterized protein n=1 Tax=Parafrankia soli TaxID=2599596 RepID=A0A1S1R1Z2_9ACTN|nr:hypothetical protein [Parafrankia soli]OHV39741.1 hypothetical protein BBK14_13825 [Parafrankia soli]
MSSKAPPPTGPAAGPGATGAGADHGDGSGAAGGRRGVRFFDDQGGRLVAIVALDLVGAVSVALTSSPA